MKDVLNERVFEWKSVERFADDALNVGRREILEDLFGEYLSPLASLAPPRY